MIRTSLFISIAFVCFQQVVAQQKPVPNTNNAPPQKETPAQRERNAAVEEANKRTSVGTQLLTPEKLWELKRVSGEALSRDGKFVYYGVSIPNVKDNKFERNIFRVSIDGGSETQITKSEGSESGVLFTNNNKILYSYKGQVYQANADGSEAKPITKNEVDYGNIKLSPDGKKILFTRDVKINKTLKEAYPDLDKANAMITDNLMYRHWDSFEDEKVSHLFVADFNGASISNEKDLTPNEPYDVPQMPMGGAEDFTWSPDGAYVLYVSKKLSGKDYAISTNTDVYMYNLSTNATTNLSEGMKGYDMAPQVSADGKTIYWLSMEREGFEADKNDLIAYDVATKTKTNATKTWDNTIEDYAIGKDGKTVFVGAYTQGTKQIFAVDPTMKKMAAAAPRQVTIGDFDIASIVGVTENALVVTRTDFNHAPELYNVKIADGSMKQITHANDDAYSKLSMCTWEKRWITTTDNQKMLVWVIMPPNFDSKKKYPALLYCQGGPQSALSQFYSFRWNFQLMASQGYIVIAPNRRGMPGHGVKWNEAISGDWGGQPIRDYLTATDSLAKEPFIDRTRIGAVGASYGGYSVYMLAGIHQNRFKTFIAHCGLFDLKSWYGTTEEMWFANWDIGGNYWTRPVPASYEKSDPINYVANWNKPIMVIHGGHDYRVPENQGMEAFQIAQLKGLKSRFLYFPEEGHWILQPQNGLLWQREFFKWLNETL